MVPDFKSIIQESLNKFVGLPINEETLDYIRLEVNDAIRRLLKENKDFFIDPYFEVEDNRNIIKFTIYKVH